MGARGPRPLPEGVLRLRGSPRADLIRSQPKPPLEPPPKPGWLGEEAGLAWDELVPRLMQMKVLSKIDGNALARYCELWVEWQTALAFVRKHGSTYPIKDGNGKIKSLGQFPQVAQIHKLSLALSRLEAEFGLTPSARTRINVPISGQPEEVDPFTMPPPNGYFAAG
ncbi:MAG: phage terminase small subunit P27 family [Phycisphaerales bacterium]|nr:phage terminase small subunit P27 family [Phycisphaerales bacterium]